MSELKNREITEKIIGSAMKVHVESGNGFQEIIYQSLQFKKIGSNKIVDHNIPINQ